MKLANKHIVVAVSGGIAAYKSAEFIRGLQRAGAQVRVAMTHSATKFISPLTFQALSGNPVHLKDNAEFDKAGMDHIALSRWSDAIIVAPATANIIAKIANGIADDFVSALCLAHEGKLAIAPAMNQAMWNNPGTQENMATLRARSVFVFGPAEGLQACGESGEGRMQESNNLVHSCISIFHSQALLGKKIIITAGPTIEPIDPVRFIGNRSSGKMGYALADAAVEAGAHVIVISGPTHLKQNPRAEYVQVETAEQMHASVLEQIDNADLFIASAAVADYKPNYFSDQKIKKNDTHLKLELTRTPDILKDVKQKQPNLYCVGFAAETENLIENATSKLHKKSIDMVIANHVGLKDQGFNSEFNAVEIISKDEKKSVARSRKTELARIIIQFIVNQLKNTKSNNVAYIQSKQN